jgi:hypothetical protein
MADPKLERQPPKNKRRDPENPLVYFDVSIGGHPSGKIVFELFKDVVPKVRVLALICHVPLRKTY